MKIYRKEIKEQAKKSFYKRYWWHVLIALIINILRKIASCTIVGYFFLTGPIQTGLNHVYKKSEKDEDIHPGHIFTGGFINYPNNLAAGALVTIFSFLWGLLFIVPGIIKLLSYDMTYYIINEKPETKANDARKLSMEMMKGYKGQLFVLLLSFIGWMLLNTLTSGVLGIFFLNSYMHQTFLNFRTKVYENYYNKATEGKKEEVVEAK